MIAVNDDQPFQDELDVKGIYEMGRADFRSGYPPTWTPHLGSLAQNEAAWGVWRRGWEDEQAHREEQRIKLLKAKARKKK